MPASSEHAERVKSGLAFFAGPEVQQHPYQLVTECFYSCLHMFEAALYDFAHGSTNRHCTNHTERTKFLGRARFDPKSPFFEVVRDYEALRGLSEQARYLSPAGTSTYEALSIPADVNDAKQLHDEIRQKLEGQYEARKRKAPWLSAGIPGR